MKGQESQHLWMLAEARVPAKQHCCCHSPQSPWQGQAGAAPGLPGLLVSTCGTGTSGKCFSCAVSASSDLLQRSNHQPPAAVGGAGCWDDPAPHRGAAGSAPCGLWGSRLHRMPFVVNDCTTLPVQTVVHHHPEWFFARRVWCSAAGPWGEDRGSPVSDFCSHG